MSTATSSARMTVDGKSGRLRDGTVVQLLPVQSTDRDRIFEFLRHLSKDSLSLRFLRPVGPETAAAEILLPSAARQRLSLLVETDQPHPGTILAHGEYISADSEPTRAEVAFLVADDHQGVGVATLLLLHLARHARNVGVQFFDAIVLPENSSMIDVFVGAGFPCSVVMRDGLEQVSLDITREPRTEILPYESEGPRARLRA
jgi:GNAT superfamily N-acetyltransferase